MQIMIEASERESKKNLMFLMSYKRFDIDIYVSIIINNIHVSDPLQIACNVLMNPLNPFEHLRAQ